MEMGKLKKIGISILAVLGILFILVIIIAALNPTNNKKETQFKEITTTSTINPNTHGCQYTDGRYCTDTCCTTGMKCLSTNINAYRKCDLSTGSWETTYQDSGCSIKCETNASTSIIMFEGVKEGDLVRFYFVFNDGNVHDGKVFFTISDSSNKTLYSDQFDVAASQYVDYQYKITGQPIGEAYEWKIPFNNIQKGMSQTGTAHLVFTTKDGTSLTADYSLLQIPFYTSDEIKQLYENNYIQSAKTCSNNCVRSDGSFEVTLVRWGYFTHLKYDTWGDEVTDYRTDIKVKNIGSEQESFYTYESAMIVGTNQYSYSYESNFDGSNMYPSIIKEGYLVFENVPANLAGSSAQLIVGKYYAGYPTGYITYSFNVNI